MKSRYIKFIPFGFTLIVSLLAAVVARADEVDEKIKALKEEVARLENEQAQMKAEQIAETTITQASGNRP